MIMTIREAGVAPGKGREARAFAVEVAAHAKDIVGIDVQVMRPVGGNPLRVAWCTRYKDLNEYEAGWSKLFADARFAELNVKAAQCFVPGSWQESIWTIL
jgi:hypothetical protein